MTRIKNVTLGDLGAIVGAAWEGLGHWAPFNTEVRRVGVSQAATNCSNSGLLACLSQTAQGDDVANRQGRSIKAIALEFRDVVAVTTSNSAIRRLIFIDWDQAGTAPTPSDVLSVAFVSTAEFALSPLNVSNTQRFEILSDELISVDTVNRPIRTEVQKFRLDSHIRYLGTTAAAASDGEGSIYVLYVSQTSSNYPTVEFFSALSFVDN